MQAGARVGIVSVGGCDPAVREAVDGLATTGIRVDYLRVRAFPFGPVVEDFLASHERIYVVEQNRDAQLRSLLVLETKAPKQKLRSVLVYGGFPLSARHVIDGVTKQEREGAQQHEVQEGAA
jgi:2-oxoglutarate ferredoxin oxidoreductase subunit alpha